MSEFDDYLEAHARRSVSLSLLAAIEANNTSDLCCLLSVVIQVTALRLNMTPTAVLAALYHNFHPDEEEWENGVRDYLSFNISMAINTDD